MNLPKSILTKKQTYSEDYPITEHRLWHPALRDYANASARYKPAGLIVDMRYDDECGNGHNTFSITGELLNRSQYDRFLETSERPNNPLACGCIHDIIVAVGDTGLQKLIKWHLTSSDGPLHYVANTVYHAKQVSNVDITVWLRPNKEMGLDGNKLLAGFYGHKQFAEIPELIKLEQALTAGGITYEVEVKPNAMNKGPDLDAARKCAVWPEANLPDLLDEQKLLDRLPALMEEFKADMEEIGFTY